MKKIGTWQRLRRTPYQSGAAILIMTLTFFVTGIFFVLASFSSSILTYFESKPQVTAFFTDKKDINSIKNLEAQLKATGKVSHTKYISKEEALSIYKEQNKNDPLLLEMVTAEILPASLEVQASDPDYLGEINSILQNEPEVEEVIFQKEIVDSLLSWTSTIRKVGLIVVAILLFVSLSILVTIIGMKIALMKEEIEVLKLVGATGSYIRMPFIMEGIFYGLVGALISWSTLYILLLYITPSIGTFLKGITALSLFSYSGYNVTIWPVSILFMSLLLLVEIVLGMGIGIIGSLLAVKRYLKS
ncbi:ABC transporter permease [Candidatus Gottesmanbacteria bacterium]|nr:ABC transporter permease [Candidatus Gottesmanbacteria bacterium]